MILYKKIPYRSSTGLSQHSDNVLANTSWPNSMAHSLADWSLASTITLNMVHKDSGMRKSVERLLLVSLDSNAPLVLLTNALKKCTDILKLGKKFQIICYAVTYRFTLVSIMSLDMSLMRLSRCLANSSSGQCKSRMKVCRASNFQNRSSDVPEPLLPGTVRY